MILIDSHAHLQDPCFDVDREEVIKRAQQKNIKYIINVSYDVASSQEAIKIGQQYKNIYIAIGMHPHHAQQWTASTYKELIQIGQDSQARIVAIGEIGLDYYRHLSPVKIQQEVFYQQLLLAQELQMPVIIHNREATQATLEILKDFYSQNLALNKNTRRGVIHCFSGDKEASLRFVELGFLIGITGAVTFPKAQELKKIAKEISLDRILIETDAPYLAPQVYRGRRNEPRYLVYVAEEIAQIREISVEQVAKQTTENAKKLFNIKD